MNLTRKVASLIGYLADRMARQRVRIWLYELALSVVLVLLSLRGFLFAPGYYAYSDQFWSVLPSLPNTQSFTLLAESGRVSPGYLFLFTRGFVTFPSLVLSNLGLPYLTWMRIFIFLSFALVLTAAWVGSEIIFRLFEHNSKRLFGTISRELAKTFCVIAFYSSTLMIEYLGDGAQFSDSLILIGFVVGLVLLIYSEKPVIALSIGCYLSVVLLLDPDYYGLVIIGFILVALLLSLKSWSLARLKWLLAALAISLPVLVYVLIGIQVTLAPTAIGGIYRPISGLPFGLQNMNVTSSLLLYGYAWPFVTLAPPTSQLFGSSLGSLTTVGNPADMVLIYSPLGYLWLASLATLPVVSIVGVVASRIRWVTGSLLAVSAVGALLAQYPNVPVLLLLLERLAALPYVGYAVGTSFALPDHLFMLIAAGYIGGSSLVVGQFLSYPSKVTLGAVQPSLAKGTRTSRKRLLAGVGFRVSLTPKRRGQFRGAVIGVVLALVILSGWQAYNGTFYPGRADYSNFSGNGLIPIGAYTPFEVSNSSLLAYSYIFHSGSNFNVYWPIGDGIAMASFTPGVPSVSLPGLPYLLSSSLSADVAPYLTAHSVRYVVVQSGPSPLQIYVPTPQAAAEPFMYYFGEPSYGSTVDVLAQCQYMTAVFSKPNITVFENLEFAGLTYPASLLIQASSEAGMNASLYGVFKQLGINATLTDSQGLGQAASINAPGDATRVAVVSPSALANAMLANASKLGREFRNLTTTLPQLANGVTYSVNSSSLGSIPEWSQAQDQGQFEYNRSGFVFTNWAGNYTASVSNGSALISAPQSTTFTLNYGGPATNPLNGVRLLPRVPIDTYVTLVAEVSVSQPSNSSIYTAFSAMGETGSLSYSQANIPLLSSAPKLVSMSSLLPPGSTAFTFRLGGAFSGQLHIAFYNVSLFRLPLITDLGLPFGNYLALNGTNNVPSGPHQGALMLVAGRGEVSGVPIESPSFVPVFVAGRAPLATSGNVSIAVVVELPYTTLAPILGHYAVYNGAFSDAVDMCTGSGSCVSPVSTVYGTNLYVLDPQYHYRLEYSPKLIVLEDAYPLIVGYLVVLSIVIWRRGGRRASLQPKGTSDSSQTPR